jgi:hypothetical protein
MEQRPAPNITFGKLIEFEDGQWVHLDTEVPIGIVHRFTALSGVGTGEISEEMCNLLAEHLIQDWYVLRRGAPLELTPAAMAEMPFQVFQAIAQEIGGIFSTPLARKN